MVSFLVMIVMEFAHFKLVIETKEIRHAHDSRIKLSSHINPSPYLEFLTCQGTQNFIATKLIKTYSLKTTRLRLKINGNEQRRRTKVLPASQTLNLK